MAKLFLENISADFLHFGLHLNPQLKVSEDAIISEVNKRLNEPAMRSQGLSILNQYVPDCSDEILSKNVIFWWQQCAKEIGSDCNNKNTTVAYEALRKILKRTGRIPDTKKQISTHITSSVTDLLKSEFKDFQSTVAALEFLENLLAEYGPTCKSSKDSVEKMLLKFVTETDVPTVKVAASRCFASLPLASAASQSSSLWSVQLEKTCNTLHYLLTMLYEDDFIISGSDEMTSTDRYHLPGDTKSDKVSATKKHALMFCNMAFFLETMLRSSFPFAKEISPLMVIRVIAHALQADHFKSLDKETRTYLTLSCNIPHIQMAVLSLMEGLIFSCSSNLLPFTIAVNRLLSDSLHWVTGSSCNFGLHYAGLIRVAVYKVVTLWMKAVKSSNIVAPILIRTLLQDLGIKKQLDNVDSGSESVTSSQNTLNQEKSRTQQQNCVDSNVNITVCHSALETLRWLLRSHRAIDLDTYKAIQDYCLRQLLCIQRCSFPSSYPTPYEAAHCRIELYKLLFTCLMEPHHLTHPAAYLIIDLLSAGQNDTNPEVAGYCTEAMSSAEKLIHPSRADFCHSLVNSYTQSMHTTTEHIPLPSQSSTFTTSSKKTVVEVVTMDSCEEDNYSYKKTTEKMNLTIVEIEGDKDEILSVGSIEPLITFLDDISSSSSDVSFVNSSKEPVKENISGVNVSVDTKDSNDPKNNVEIYDSDVQVSNNLEQHAEDKSGNANSSTPSGTPVNTGSNDAVEGDEFYVSDFPSEANEEISGKDENIENNSGKELLQSETITFVTSEQIDLEVPCEAESSEISEIVVNTVTISHTKRPASATDEPEVKKKKVDSSEDDCIAVQDEVGKEQNSKTVDSDTEPSEVDIDEVNEVCSMITLD